MKMLLKISWLNLWRNRQRSIVMIIAVMAGLWGGIFAASIMFGLINQRFESSIEQQISHVQIHHPEFLKDYNVKYSIDRWENLKDDLDSDHDVIAFSGRTQVNGMLRTATLTAGVNIMGIDPQMEANTISLDKNIVEGNYLEKDFRNPVLIGKSLAEKVKARIGSRIVLTFQDVDGELAAGSFRVAGIYQTAATAWDEMHVFALQTELNELLGCDEIINEVGILTHDHEKAAGFADKYKEHYPNLEIRTWSEISPELAFLQEMATMMYTIIIIIILLALAFGLLNTMLMAVIERIKELGVLMAIGMNKTRIFIMILLETMILSLTGAVLGMIAGYFTTSLLGIRGMDLSVVGGDALHEYGFDSVIYPVIEPSVFVIITVLVILTALFTSIFPALKALRLKPAEAVQAE